MFVRVAQKWKYHHNLIKYGNQRWLLINVSKYDELQFSIQMNARQFCQCLNKIPTISVQKELIISALSRRIKQI